jgi:SHAQKYF class myb-like DNA-binding protein
MATAPVAQPSALGDQGENTGRWTSEEHRLFLQGLDQHGKGWKKIASLIKSRTVVQIRTHAQKYFQKLSKARQNGEEGDVTMEGRGGLASVTSVSSAAAGAAQSGKRRRPTTGTKRKAIHSVVASAQREGKRLAAAQAHGGVPDPVPPLPAVAPILAYFALPYASDVPATSSADNPGADGNISGPALEDSL